LNKILPVVLALSSLGLATLSSPVSAEPMNWKHYAHIWNKHKPTKTTSTNTTDTNTTDSASTTTADVATTTTTTDLAATTTTTNVANTSTTTDGATTTTSAPAPASPTTSGGVQLDARLTCNLPNFQQEIINRINQARAAGRTCGSTSYGPAAALSWNGVLFNAAAGHSTDMAANNYFSHTGLDGSDPGLRITGAGYAWSAYGENIAAGQTTVQTVVDGWLNSPGHCANIMNPSYTEIATACVTSETAQYKTYWSMELARPY